MFVSLIATAPARVNDVAPVIVKRRVGDVAVFTGLN